MLDLLRRRDFALLWLAGFVSRLGDVVLLVALPFYVYEMTGSALATGGMMVAETLPRVLFGSVAGVFVDRWDRRRTLVATEALRGLSLLPLLLVGSADQMWIVYAVGFGQATIGQFFAPARSALIPRLVPRERLVAANALSAQVDAAVGLIGPTLGGVLLLTLGLGGVVWADGASFWLSAALLALLSRSVGTPPASPAAPAAASAVARWRGVWLEWREGLSLIRSRPSLIAVLLTLSAVVFADGVANVLYVPFFRSTLGVGPLELGWIVTASSAGAAVGVLLIGYLGDRLRPAYLIALGVVAAGLGNLLTVAVPVLWFVIVLRLLLVPAIPGINIGIQAVVQGEVEDRFRGRVFGAAGTTAGLVTLSGMVVSSALGDRLGIGTLLAGSGVLYLAAGAVALALMRRERLPGAASAAAG